jgi:hypothetical protein
MVQPLFPRQFYHDGRGPTLVRMHWGADGQVLEAIDFALPDAVGGPAGVQHVRFTGLQVVAITPEEVIDYARTPHLSESPGRAALFDLGRSAWMATFNPRHLTRCRHFQLFFYDELVDVIAEGVSLHAGGYTADKGTARPRGAISPGASPGANTT